MYSENGRLFDVTKVRWEFGEIIGYIESQAILRSLYFFWQLRILEGF